MKSTLNFFSYLDYFLPMALVTGPFISDLIVSTSANFFFILFNKKIIIIFILIIFF